MDPGTTSVGAQGESQARVKALTLFLQSEQFRKLAEEIAQEEVQRFLYPITTEDHEAGRKVCEVELRSGEKQFIEIRALPLREAMNLRKVFEEEKDIWVFLESALPASERSRRERNREPQAPGEVLPHGHQGTEGWDFIDRLAPRCADGLLRVALGLTFGETDQKKMLAWLEMRRRSISVSGLASN